MYCERCGSALLPTDRFCGGCGAAAPAASAPVPPAPVLAGPAAPGRPAVPAAPVVPPYVAAGHPGGRAGPIDPRSGVPLADLGTRFAAYLVDGGLMLGGLIVVGVLGSIADPLGTVLALAWFAACAAVLVIGDGGALGQTPGKNLLGVKVVGAAPGPIGYGRGALRWVGRMVDTILCCLPVGLVWALFDAERRTWHDLIADTRVVVAPPTVPRSLAFWWRNVRLQPPHRR